MGFSAFEKNCFTDSLRNQEEIDNIIDNNYPEDIVRFLKDQNLLKLVRDYSIISHKSKLHKPESLTMTYLLDPDINIYDILHQWQEFLSPPVSLLS